MPELPEVQTLVDDLIAAGLVGQTVTAARVHWSRSAAVPAPNDFCRRIRGKTITSIRRRGKFLVLDLSAGYYLLIHLRMSGRLHLVAAKTKRSKHEHIVLSIGESQQLRLHDTRKFGRMYLLEDVQTVLGKLGIEPLERRFTAAAFRRMLGAKKRQIKPLLLDQTFIAGLGNIYVDEALWTAKIHPLRPSNSLSAAECAALQRAIRRVLRRGLKNLGTSLGTGRANFYSVARRRGRNQDQLMVFRRNGEPCPRCNTPIERIIVGQRSTHICKRCQRP
ncbi:MAG: formamidopyrimidine-DNA glycosylase [Deltaproteobacteria bacterium SG8_13]|nr:MAG: formamidopyrimidine-DNA glycosylase [Deltaproteobacteria bacterium SG8_13]